MHVPIFAVNGEGHFGTYQAISILPQLDSVDPSGLTLKRAYTWGTFLGCDRDRHLFFGIAVNVIRVRDTPILGRGWLRYGGARLSGFLADFLSAENRPTENRL